MPTRETDFILVTGTGKNGQTKGKNKTTAHTPTHVNITQASYAAATANVANKSQGQYIPWMKHSLLTITEITVLRSSGHPDSLMDQCIRAWAPDVIVREVYNTMKKVVAKPIPLRAGRWSINPRSKGNFMYSFDSNIPFNEIQAYEHILLSPFQGTGQLCPSLGWT